MCRTCVHVSCTAIFRWMEVCFLKLLTIMGFPVNSYKFLLAHTGSKLTCNFQQLETFAFDFLSGNGDYLDIRHIVSPEDRPDVTKTSKEELQSLVGCHLLFP